MKDGTRTPLTLVHFPPQPAKPPVDTMTKAEAAAVADLLLLMREWPACGEAGNRFVRTLIAECSRWDDE